MTIYLRTSCGVTNLPEREITIDAETCEFQPFNNQVEFYNPAEEWEQIDYNPENQMFTYNDITYDFCFVRP